MALTFDPLAAARKLRENGAEESLATATVEVVQDATSDLVTRDHFDARLDTRIADVRGEIAALRADLYRALWIQGGAIITIIAALFAVAEAVGR